MMLQHSGSGQEGNQQAKNKDGNHEKEVLLKELQKKCWRKEGKETREGNFYTQS